MNRMTEQTPDLGNTAEQTPDLDLSTEQYIQAILATEEYKNYKAELDKVKKDPELKNQIDSFRERNYLFQIADDNDFNKLDRFEKEYENFRDNLLVADFLAAELAFCRLMQRQNIRIIAQFHFE